MSKLDYSKDIHRSEVIYDKDHLNKLAEKFKAVSKEELIKFAKQKCEYYSTKRQEELEVFGFENGRKYEFNPPNLNGESILLIQKDYKKRQTEVKINKISKISSVFKNKEKDVDLDDRKDEILKLLSKEREKYKCMAIGEHKGHYYFGTILRDNTPAIILDNGEVFGAWHGWEDGRRYEDNEIKKKFGLKYRFELFEDVVDNLWGNKSIKEFIEGKSRDQSFNELYEIIRKKNKELVYHVNDRIHSFIACDIISNYFYPLFNAKGRTYFQADFGSGKSRQSLIYQKLSFNSLFASNISSASFERVIESTGGTIIVDNFDNVNEDLKKAILQCIEVYYKKGGKNIKADGTKTQRNKPIAFNGYSPLVINNIIGLPEVTESRCNKIQMLRTDKKNIVDVKINENDIFWEETKDNLHILALQKWKEVKEMYGKLEVKELSARDLERTEAVLTIAKIIGEEVYEDILNYILETNQQQSIRDLSDNWEFILFEFLHKNIQDQNELTFTSNYISKSVKDKIVVDEKREKQELLKYSRYIGKILSNLPNIKKSVLNGITNYTIKKKSLLKMIQIKGFDKYIDSFQQEEKNE